MYYEGNKTMEGYAHVFIKKVAIIFMVQDLVLYENK